MHQIAAQALARPPGLRCSSSGFQPCAFLLVPKGSGMDPRQTGNLRKVTAQTKRHCSFVACWQTANSFSTPPTPHPSTHTLRLAPTVSGSPCSACRMKLLTTRPSFMCIRGPKVLKILATRTSTPSWNRRGGCGMHSFHLMFPAPGP